MKWNNLKVNKCPKCNKDMSRAKFDKELKTIICGCGFKIKEKRMAEIVSDKVKRDLDVEFILDDTNSTWEIWEDA